MNNVEGTEPSPEGDPDPAPDAVPDAAPEAAPEAAPDATPAVAYDAAPVAAAPGLAPVPGPMPGAWATLSGGLDLSFSANRELRRASVYIGLLTLGLVGPFAVIILAFGAAQGGFDWIAEMVVGLQPDLVPVDPSVGAFMSIAGMVALAGFVVISIESQIMAAAILGGRALGRPMTMREALRRSRQVFWSVVGATLLVGLILFVPNIILNTTFSSIFGAASEAPTLILTALGALLSAPFAYLVTGIVLGDVGASEAVRRSARLARARWRLAIAVSAVGAVVGYLELFATGAGVDILARVGGALHLGFDSSAGTLALAVVVAAGVLAIGSLTFTVAALRDAPQVVAFVGMTGYGAGLDRSREDGRQRHERWVSLPMEIAIFIAVLAGIGGVLALS